MSETLLDLEGRITITRFAGGRERGPMIQIDVEDVYVQLTRDEVSEVYTALRDYLMLKMGPHGV